jgi:transposase-like protein
MSLRTSQGPPKITEVLPLYLHGLSTQDFAPALEGLLGTGAGPSVATITRLTGQWQDEARQVNKPESVQCGLVYLWADGVHLDVRQDEENLDELLAFYDYPAEQWLHLRTTNPMESTFATVRHRTKVTKGPRRSQDPIHRY